MDTREDAGTFDLSVHGISQQPGTEDPLHVPAEDTHMAKVFILGVIIKYYRGISSDI